MKYQEVLYQLTKFMHDSEIEYYCKNKCSTHGCCTENDCQNLDDCKNRAACKSYLCPDLRVKIFTERENRDWIKLMGEIYIKVLVKTDGYNSYFHRYSEEMDNIVFSNTNLKALTINPRKILRKLNRAN